MQIYIIYIIGAITILIIGLRVYHHITKPKDTNCSGCDGCPLKEKAKCSPQSKPQNRK